MGGAALASVLHVTATHRHHIIVVPSLLSNRRYPIAVLELLLLWSLTSSPSAAAAASFLLLSPSPSPSPSHPSPSSPSSSTVLRRRRIVIVVKMGGGKFPWYLSYVFLRRIFGKAACGLICGNSVFGDHLLPGLILGFLAGKENRQQKSPATVEKPFYLALTTTKSMVGQWNITLLCRSERK